MIEADGNHLSLHLSYDNVLFIAEQMMQANVLFASQVEFIRYFAMKSKEKSPNVFTYHPVHLSSICCSWVKLIEEVTIQRFSSGKQYVNNGFKPIRLVELGINAARTGHYMLSRYPWLGKIFNYSHVFTYNCVCC